MGQNKALSNEQVAEIQRILDASIPTGSTICLTRETIYRRLQERGLASLLLDMEQYRFERALTAAIRNERITGYEMKRGRGGGVCRKGTCKGKSSGHCELTINGRTYRLPMSEQDAEQFIMGILGARPAQRGNGQILINNHVYTLPKAILLSNCVRPESEKLLANCLKAMNAQGIDDDKNGDST